MGSMPVHDTVNLGEVNLDQAAATGATAACPGLWLISGAVRGTHQPMTRIVKKAVGLVVHLHRHMGATIQVGVHLALVPNGKGTASLATIDHVKRNCFAAIEQIGRVAQGNDLGHAGTVPPSGIDQQPVMEFAY